MSGTVVPASFRDPAGFVWTDQGKLYRQVNEYYRPHYDLLMSSGLYEALTSDGSLVTHEEVSAPARSPDGYKVLAPEKVAFISYPYEWSFAQLRDAALLTLHIQKRAIDFGMSLRDASAYNIQFHRGRPVLIDTLSFEVLEEGKPWIGYRQYCQHFLAPLALMAKRDVRMSSLMRIYIDGVPLDLAASLLPRRTRYRPSLGLHIHAHARSQKRYEGRDVGERVGSRRFSVQALKGLVASLERATNKMAHRQSGSAWSSYYEEAAHYTDAAASNKQRIVGEFLDKADGTSVWDLGGNIGVFSREATVRGKEAVCFDVDPLCVEMNYKRVREEGETAILPLLCDLTNPSPGTGWAHEERSSLRDRGPADIVMALALIHHLAIGNNVPLPLVARYFGEISRWLIIEFVPKSDPMVQQLMRTRSDIFTHYTREGFEAAFGDVFDIVDAQPIEGTERVMYLGRTGGSGGSMERSGMTPRS